MPEKDQLTLEWVDHETCDSCNHKFKPEECADCIYLILKKEKEWIKSTTKQNPVKDAEQQ